MSTLKVDNITDEAGTGAPDFPNGLTGLPQLTEPQVTDPDDETFGTVSGERLAQAGAAGLQALAEGAPDAPRVVGDALNLRVADVDPAGMESVVFIDLEPADWVLEFYTIQPSSSSNRTLILDPSYDNGATFLTGSGQTVVLSESFNFRSTAFGRLGGLSGFVKASNNCISDGFTGAPKDDITFDGSRVLSVRSLHRAKPFQPMNAMRIRWSFGSFGADDNQRIVLYQGGRRPFGGKA